MKSHRMGAVTGFALLTVLGGALCAIPAWAQGPGDGPPPGQGPQDGPPPPGGGPGGQGRRGGPGGPGPGMRPGGMIQPPMNVTHIPIDVLASELTLTSTQKDKIVQLQKDFMQQARPPRPSQDEQDGPPDPEAMRTRMDRIRTLDQSTTKQIESVLTSAQKQALPSLYKTLDSLRVARIPLELVGSLHLTADQKQQLSALRGQGNEQNQKQQQEGDQARRSGQFGATRNIGGQQGQQHEKAMAILTADQRKIVTDFMQKHPRPQGRPGFGPPPDGPGGQGGPGGFGGPGGPGGSRDGQDGLPPPSPGE